MSSLKMVEYLNEIRKKEGETPLLHKNLLAKVPQVLGIHSAEFSAQYKDSTGRSLPCFHFPKREATLMAMSYSYALQAKVFDRMTANLK